MLRPRSMVSRRGQRPRISSESWAAWAGKSGIFASQSMPPPSGNPVCAFFASALFRAMASRMLIACDDGAASSLFFGGGLLGVIAGFDVN